LPGWLKYRCAAISTLCASAASASAAFHAAGARARGIYCVEDRFACQPPARQSATGDGGAGCASTISQLSPVRPRMSLSASSSL
jgi:hypothetical protein